MEEAKRALDEEILQLKTDLETDKRGKTTPQIACH